MSETFTLLRLQNETTFLLGLTLGTYIPLFWHYYKIKPVLLLPAFLLVHVFAVLWHYLELWWLFVQTYPLWQSIALTLVDGILIGWLLI